MDIDSALIQLGLSPSESKIYLTTLKLGLAKASDIAAKARILRGAAYYALDILKEKGLISEIIQSNTKHYSAATPSRIIEMINDEYAQKKETATNLKKELELLQKVAITPPLIEIFEGYDGFKTLFTRLLDYHDCAITCYLSPQILDYLPHFHEQFRKLRSQKKISIRTITQDTKEMREIRKSDKEELRELRFLDKIITEAPILQYILPDAIIIIRANKQEQMGYIIHDKTLRQLQLNMFEHLWKHAHK